MTYAYCNLATRLENRKTPTFPSPSPGQGLRRLLNGCALLTVSKYFLCLLCTYTQDIPAEEELSRQKGYSIQSKHTTPTPTTTTDAVIVGSAEAAPPIPLIPPSSESPEHGSPPSPALQQTHDRSPSSPVLQPQQTTSTVSPQDFLDHSPPLSPSLATTLQPEDTNVQEPPSLCPHPPEPENVEPAPHLPEPENVEPAPTLASPTINPNHLERTAPPAGMFAFAGTSAFTTSAMVQYLQTISAGPCWVEMVTAYLCFEEFPAMKLVHAFRIAGLFFIIY